MSADHLLETWPPGIPVQIAGAAIDRLRAEADLVAYFTGGIDAADVQDLLDTDGLQTPCLLVLIDRDQIDRAGTSAMGEFRVVVELVVCLPALGRVAVPAVGQPRTGALAYRWPRIAERLRRVLLGADGVGALFVPDPDTDIAVCVAEWIERLEGRSYRLLQAARVVVRSLLVTYVRQSSMRAT